MPRTTRRSWWYGITPGGLIVTATVALVAVAFAGTACWLYVHGEKDSAKEAGLAAAGALSTLVALQARNRPDPAATIEQPATVTASSSGQTDSGHASTDLLLFLVITAAVFTGGLLLHVALT